MSAERACEVCGGIAADLVYVVDSFPVVRCRECRLVFVGREPSREELLALYDESYWDDPAAAGYDGYAAAEERKRHHFRTLLAQVERFARPGAMLELGSAYGYFLDEARRRGWAVRGIEPSQHAAAHARERLGLDVVPGPLTEVPVEPDSLDTVVLWDVVEHLPDPRRTLERAFQVLRPGGILALSTGDVDSLSSRLHGVDWSLMTPPWHQFYFSRRTMRRLLEDIGFRIEQLEGDGCVAVDPASSRPRVPRAFARVLVSPTVTAVARRARAGMTMFVFARKERAR